MYTPCSTYATASLSFVFTVCEVTLLILLVIMNGMHSEEISINVNETVNFHC